MFGNPRPRYAIFAPCFTPAGPAALGRDRESAKQVWSQREGYPGDQAYRDFYRDIGHDLDLEYLRPFLPPDGSRRFTGIKYHRITGRTPNKEIYVPGWAQGAADHHAGDFMVSRTKQIEHLVQVTNIEPIILSPFDAELFGHWWYEGPMFLNFFIRKAVYDQKIFELTTPSAYLEKHDTLQILSPSPSSWGNKGFWEVWLDESNSWIYPHLHAAARRMAECARAAKEKLTEISTSWILRRHDRRRENSSWIGDLAPWDRMLAMSAFFSRVHGDRIRDADFHACLPKPFTPNQLVETILAVLQALQSSCEHEGHLV